MVQRTLGVVGGGQLCRMMAEAVHIRALPFDVIALDPTPECPAYPFLREQIIAGFQDGAAIRQLAKKADIVTYEFEHINAAVLEELEHEGVVVRPTAKTLGVIQDKLAQKAFLRNNGLPVPDYMAVQTMDDLHEAGEHFGYPLMIKSRKGGYDGKGNFLVHSPDQLEEAARVLQRHGALMVERYVPFDKEVSVIAARSMSEIETYPLGENLHDDNILRMTIVPARVDEKVAEKAQKVAAETMKVLKGEGVFGIEMFVRGSDVLINEIAPRVHNSGHYTIEACPTSQFEQHLRAITGMPLGSTELLSPAVMVNLLGEKGYSGKPIYQGLDGIGHPHIYGKHETKPLRKMGHVTIVKPTLEEALKKAEIVRTTVRVVA